MRQAVTAAILAGCILGATAQVRADDRTGVLVGVDARENSYYGYAGLTRHFGENPFGDGVIGRAVVYGGEYQYSTTAVTGGQVRSDFAAVELLAGYQKVFTSFTLRGYAGAEYERHQLSPDNVFDSNRGDAFGAKVRADIETDFALPYYGNLIATYGSARERYWVRARGGWDFSGFVVGPEVIATGDKLAHEERAGVFMNVRAIAPSLVSVSAGWARTPSTSAGTTPYVTLEFSTTF